MLGKRLGTKSCFNNFYVLEKRALLHIILLSKIWDNECSISKNVYYFLLVFVQIPCFGL